MSGHGPGRGGGASRSFLTFEPAVVTFPWGTPRSPVEREVHFLEPVVDGVALRDRIVDHGVVGVFAAGLPGLGERTAEELLGLRACGDLPPGRVGLLVCQVCEDLGDATFRFDRSAYEAAVRGAALAVADLPTWQPPARRSWWRRG